MAHITKEQRYAIKVLKEKGKTLTYIAQTIGKHKSVVSREIMRNKNQKTGTYDNDLAERKYQKRLKEKKKHIRFNEQIRKNAEELLKKDYSPEQIAGYCKEEGIECVSHETIYRYIWSDKKKGGDLHKHLRRKGRKYRKRGNKTDTRGIIPNRTDIEKRPEIVEKRERFGDLEVDTVIGKNHKGALVTINDRASGMLKSKKVESKESCVVADAIIEMLQDWLPFIKTMTSDNGKEFAEHERISEELGIDFYFAKPYHSWQRGSNENLNGLIRQYIPKKTDLNNVADIQIDTIVKKLNNRPRKRYSFKNPIFVMNKLLFNKKVAFVT
jgi:IS30 family transposase